MSTDLTRREALASITGVVAAAPVAEGDSLTAAIAAYDRCRQPLAADERAMERALLAAHDLLDALHEFMNLHDMEHPQHNCPCDACHDANGFYYLISGPFTILECEFVKTIRLCEREKKSEAFRASLSARLRAARGERTRA